MIDQVNSADPGFRWRTLLDLGVEAGRLWLRVRVQLYSAFDGLVARPKYAVGRPGLIRDLADTMNISVDGHQLGSWQILEEDKVDGYVERLLDQKRRLPIVAVSTQANGQPLVRPAHLADRMLGLAHVVLVPEKSAYLVTDAIGKSLSCYLGALRVYWPGFTPQDDPYHHRAYVGGTLTHLGPEGVVDNLLDLVGRAAGLSIAEPPLRNRLRIERRDAERAQRVADAEAARERLSAVAVSTEGGVDAATWESFTAEYDQAQLRIQQVEQELLDAQISLEELEDERDRIKVQAQELAKAMAFGRPLPTDVAPAAEPPTSVAEAVRRAQTTCPALVLLPEALTSAEESQYDDPSRVLADLELLNEIAAEWQQGLLPSGPHEALKVRCNGYRDGVSDTALTTYPGDYRRSYEGETIELGPHIARGKGAVSAIMRIYWHQDTTRRCMAVGHVGRKLRDNSNRN